MKLGVLKELGDEDARKELYEHNLRMAATAVDRYRGNGRSFMDLLPAAIEALEASILAWRPQEGKKFSSYAWPSLVKTVNTHAFSPNSQVGRPKDAPTEIKRYKEACGAHGIDPYSRRMSEHEIASKLHYPENVVARIRDMIFSEVPFNAAIERCRRDYG